jgi:SAM-dependent methyltransferase
VILGIPDFRVFPDPYIDLGDDRKKALKIADQLHNMDFRGLLEHYWSITPHGSSKLVRRYIRYACTGVDRGRRTLETIEVEIPTKVFGPERCCLELGCGTGGFLVAATGRFDRIVGIDIAFRWLIVAKKRLEEAGGSAQLVCCCAEYLPFPGAFFDLVVAVDVLEHAPHQEQLIREAGRALRPGGVFYATTANRWSLAPEPNVRVWGVGWLPRQWMKPYVRFFRGIDYEHVRLLSFPELKRMARRAFFGSCRVGLPAFSAAEMKGLSAVERILAAAHNRIRTWPGFRSLLLACGPKLRLICRKDAQQSSGCAP